MITTSTSILPTLTSSDASLIAERVSAVAVSIRVWNVVV